MNKKILHTIIASLMFFQILISASLSYSQTLALVMQPDKNYFKEFILKGEWKEACSVATAASQNIVSRMYLICSGDISGEISNSRTKIGYGAALNFKYYSGLSYEYLRKNLPGKTISIDVNIPKESVSSDDIRPSKLRVSVKSNKGDDWADYCGDIELFNIRKEGMYTVKLKVPSQPVTTRTGKTFSPEDSVLFCVEHYLMEGPKSNSNMAFTFTNFKIEGIDLDQGKLRWQLLKDGYVVKDTYIQDFEAGSAIIREMNGTLQLQFNRNMPDNIKALSATGGQKDITVSFAIYIPPELRGQKGTASLIMQYGNGETENIIKTFSECATDGKIYISSPLSILSKHPDIKKALNETKMTLTLNTATPLTTYMLPIVVEPLWIINGKLCPFDSKWYLRDIQGLGGYSKIDIREDGRIEKGGITVKALNENLYQLDLTARLQGGLNWKKNSFYRVELLRDFENGPVNMDNMHLEVLMSPTTDLTENWQKPFRGRLGLVDINGNIIFGPNVSLSEALPNLAYIDVSITNPMPKGITMPGFDPTRVKSIVINLESPHTATPIMDINISLINLIMKPNEYKPAIKPRAINYSRFKRDPGLWQLTKISKNSGGYVLGINYPFPAINVSPQILKVPQVYPTVGKKPTDVEHFGFSSPITKEQTIKDMKVFAKNNINIVRLFTLGHLEGVFSWDYKGRDITGFSESSEKLFREAAGMKVENLTKFLRKNEETLFGKNSGADLPGLGEHVMKDFYAILDILEQVEKDTGKKVTVVISLFDFLLGDGSVQEGPYRIFYTGEHQEVVTDDLVKVKAEALIWKMMKTLAKDKRFYKYISIVEIMNEPDNASALTTKENFPKLVNFIGEGLYLLKDALGPTIPVTNGFRCWYNDLKYWKTTGEGVDVLMPHYWESLESYNIDIPSVWPMEMPVNKLWELLGTKRKGRITGIGEIGPLGSIRENLFSFEKAGYDFAMIWSYSGHDGYDAKPVMNKIAQYQEGNHRFAAIKKLPSNILNEAFSFIKKTRIEFDKRNNAPGRYSPNYSNSKFFHFLLRSSKNITDDQVRAVTLKIFTVSVFKDIPLELENIDYLHMAATTGKAD